LFRRSLGLWLSFFLLAEALAPANVAAQSQSTGSGAVPAPTPQSATSPSPASGGTSGTGSQPGTIPGNPAAGNGAPPGTQPGAQRSTSGAPNGTPTGSPGGNASPAAGPSPSGGAAGSGTSNGRGANGTNSGGTSTGGSTTGGSTTGTGSSSGASRNGTSPNGASPSGTGTGSSGGSMNGGSSGGGSAGGGRAGGGLPPPPQPPVLPLVPNIAPGYSAPSVGLPPGELVGVDQQPFVGISLSDAIAMALRRNTDLAVAQANRRIAGFQIVSAQGAYDVRFQVQPTYEHTVAAPLSPFQAGPNFGPITTDTAGISAGFSALSTNGGRYRLDFNAQRVNTDNTSVGYSPYYPTSISLNVTQPLLRGVRADDTRRQILLAQNAFQNNADTTLVQASSTIVNVSDAYWDLVSAWRNVAIQEEGLRQAQTQANSNRRLARAGQVAPVDIIEANTQVDVFQDNVFSALQNVQRLQTQIKSLVLANPADPLWVANLVPTSAVGEVPAEPNVNDAIALAIKNRPELAQLRNQRRSADINLAFAVEQLKPQLDLQFGYTTNGFAGLPSSLSQNPIFAFLTPQIAAINNLNALAGLPPLPSSSFSTPGYLNGHINRSFLNLAENRLPTYSAQLLLSFPIGNRTAKADVAAAREQERSVNVQEIALLQRVKSEAYNALQQLRSTRYRLVAARSAREASERVYLSERRRFAIGTSTTFLVLQRALDLSNNRGRELQAQTDLNKAVVELQRVTGGAFSGTTIDLQALGEETRAATPSTSGSSLSPASSGAPAGTTSAPGSTGTGRRSRASGTPPGGTNTPAPGGGTSPAPATPGTAPR